MSTGFKERGQAESISAQSKPFYGATLGDMCATLGDRSSMSTKENPHIIYVITKLELGGAQKVCLTLLNNSACPTSLISGTEGVLVPEANKHNTTYLIKYLKREVGVKSIFLEIAAFFSMIARMRKIKKAQPSSKEHKRIIVHTHSTKAGLMGRWAAFFAGIKKRVHTVHGFGFHEHQSKLTWTVHVALEYITSLITTHYVCVSNADKKIGTRLFPRFAKKSSIIRASIETNKFGTNKFGTKKFGTARQTSCKLKNHFIFGTVSCLKPQKNILDLLQAFEHMYHQLPKHLQELVHLQIIGDGEQRNLIEEWLSISNMAHKVDLCGWQADVASWMQTWDTFVMSSLWEGLPCAVIEARYSKLPVISYKIAGIPEVIKNKKNGFLVKPGDWRTLGKRMLEVFLNRTLHQQLATHQENLNDFTNEAMIAKHIKLYKKLSS